MSPRIDSNSYRVNVVFYNTLHFKVVNRGPDMRHLPSAVLQKVDILLPEEQVAVGVVKLRCCHQHVGHIICRMEEVVGKPAQQMSYLITWDQGKTVSHV